MLALLAEHARALPEQLERLRSFSTTPSRLLMMPSSRSSSLRTRTRRNSLSNATPRRGVAAERAIEGDLRVVVGLGVLGGGGARAAPGTPRRARRPCRGRGAARPRARSSRGPLSALGRDRTSLPGDDVVGAELDDRPERLELSLVVARAQLRPAREAERR